ncbi:MAG: MBL fold metallo-hydrolase [Candidatus Acidiferrales bacterium]
MTRGLRFCVSAIFFIAVSATCAPAQPGTTDYSKATTKTVKLRGNLTLIEIATAEDLNKVLVLSGPEGLLLVDHPEAVAAPIVKKALDEMGWQPVKFLIDTHWHYDHVGGNEIYGPDAVIVAQENVRSRLSTAQTPPWTKTLIGPYPEKAWPRVTYRDSMAIHFDGEDIELDHYAPGHTDGDSVVYFAKANVLHLADVYDGKATLAGGADILGIAKSLAAVRDRINDDTLIVTGHSAALSNRAELSEYILLLDKTIAQVQSEVASGKSKSEIVEAGMPAFWQEWFAPHAVPAAHGFVQQIYESVTHTNRFDQ